MPELESPIDTREDVPPMTDSIPLPAPRPTSVKAVRNGPLQLKGTFRLLDPDGEEYDLEGQRIVLLCRCGRSANQPFCDSSHRRTGWASQDQPTVCEDSGDGAA
jgi:CDGSH-type Zn-finger protein